jgi:hypothetical protein
MSRSRKNAVRKEGAGVGAKKGCDFAGDKEGLAAMFEGSDVEGVGCCDGIDKRSSDSADSVSEEKFEIAVR